MVAHIEKGQYNFLKFSGNISQNDPKTILKFVVNKTLAMKKYFQKTIFYNQTQANFHPLKWRSEIENMDIVRQPKRKFEI